MLKTFLPPFFHLFLIALIDIVLLNRNNWNIPRRRFLTSVNWKESQEREAFILPFTLFSIYAPLVRRRKYSLEQLRHDWAAGGLILRQGGTLQHWVWGKPQQAFSLKIRKCGHTCPACRLVV